MKIKDLSKVTFKHKRNNVTVYSFKETLCSHCEIILQRHVNKCPVSLIHHLHLQGALNTYITERRVDCNSFHQHNKKESKNLMQ